MYVFTRTRAVAWSANRSRHSFFSAVGDLNDKKVEIVFSRSLFVVGHVCDFGVLVISIIRDAIIARAAAAADRFTARTRGPYGKHSTREASEKAVGHGESIVKFCREPRPPAASSKPNRQSHGFFWGGGKKRKEKLFRVYLRGCKNVEQQSRSGRGDTL